MGQMNDTQIRAGVRSTLTQLRLDVQALSIASARGVIRITGELKRNTAEAPAIRASMLEDFERELKRVKGVRRVHLSPTNWRQSSGGTWVSIGDNGRSSGQNRTNRAAPNTYAEVTVVEHKMDKAETPGLSRLLTKLKSNIRSIPLYPA